jgi:hypothetical protein
MKKFARIYQKLDRQCCHHSRHLGHLKGLFENDDWTRIVHGSKSGHALDLGNLEIINALVLFNTRMFDQQTDTITVHKLSAKLPNEQQVEQYHADRMEELGIKYELESHYAARKKFILANRKLHKKSTISKLKSLRKLKLAHNIDEPAQKPDKATLNDLVVITEAVNGLVDLAGYIVLRHEKHYPQLSDRAEKTTRMLFAALPTLADVEKE